MVNQGRTDGSCALPGSQGVAQISERVRVNDRDKAKVQGSMDKRVQRWRVRTPASHVTGQGASCVMIGEVEGVVIQENVGYEVAGSVNARVLNVGNGVVGAEAARHVNHGLS